MEFREAPTLEFKGKDFIDEHGSFILEIPQGPCSSNASPESATLCAPSTYEDYNHLKVEIKENDGQATPKNMGATQTTVP
uniref:Uncharacterized protein n=1 Tax=Setaria italica TaxID=4555 RepID=K3Y3J4_SETIT